MTPSEITQFTGEEGIFLVEAFRKQFFIGHISPCTLNFSLQDFIEWLSCNAYGLIPLNEKYGPQQVQHKEFCRLTPLSRLIDKARNDVLYRRKTALPPEQELPDDTEHIMQETFNWTMDFRELLKALWDLETQEFWAYEERCRGFFETKFDQIFTDLLAK